ncbi:MAG: hypothetical protein KDK48_03985, partial [Chlamydiia bacterium]|nr:hypothetical protein [Chlamydiia bacterium]
GMINKDITPNLDEVDTLLNVLHEVSFSMGDPNSPEPWETRMTGHLYRMLMEDPSLKKIARLEVDRKPHPEAQPLTKKRYEEKLKPALAEKFIQSLGALDLGDSARNKEVETFTKGLNPQSRTLLLRYLTRDKRNVAETEAFFNKQNESVQDLLALAAEEINGILPHTLTRTVKDNYGVDHDSANLFAIPFGGPNVPKKGSQFLSPHVTMAYTYQYYLHEGISVSVVEKLIAQLQSQAMKEVQEGAVSIDATEAWQEFAKLKGDHPIPLFRYTPDQLEGLTNALNRSTEKQCFFVEQFIIPKMEIHPEKISCNPLNLIEFLPRASGFTGTLWNSAGMHRKLNTKQAAGTDAKTLAILWNNSYDKVRRLENTRMETLIKNLGKENVNLIADAGAYFRDATNEEVAKALSEARGMPCVFYNTRNEQAIWIDGRVELLSEVKIPPAERITFLDYSHCTGADVPQKADATGFVTIGPNMLTRDLLQSVWRLRGLADKQKVEFVLSDDVEKLIRDRLSLKEGAPIHFPEILRFTELNQVERQGTDTMKGLNEELAAFQQGLLIRCLISDKLTADEKSKALKALRSLWIKPAIIPPRKLYGKVATMEDAQKVAKTEGNHAKDTVSALIRELPFLAKVGVTMRSASAEIDMIVGHKAPNLPDKVLMPKEVDADQSVEVETSTEQEQEIQVEQEEQTESTFHELGQLLSQDTFERCDSIEDFQGKIEYARRYYVRTNPAIDLSLFMESREQMAPVAKAFKGLAVSANMFNWEDRKRAPKIEEMELFGSYRKPFHYLTANGIAVSVAENGTAQNITLDTRNMDDQELLRVVQMKFLDGQSRFDKRERPLLKEWLEANDVEALKKFYIGQVLNGKPDKAARFQGSDLMRIFLELGTKKAPKKAP